MDRRLFLRGLTGIIVGAPAIVSASSLMKIIVPKQEPILLATISETMLLVDFYGGEVLEQRLAQFKDMVVQPAFHHIYVPPPSALWSLK